LDEQQLGMLLFQLKVLAGLLVSGSAGVLEELDSFGAIPREASTFNIEKP